MIYVMKSSFKIVYKTKITLLFSETLLSILKQKYILFLETYFFNIPKKLIAFGYFFCRGRYSKTKICLGKSLECCTGKTY